MVTLDNHKTSSLTVMKRVFNDFLVYEIVGIDDDGRKTKVQFFSQDMDLVMDDVVVRFEE